MNFGEYDDFTQDNNPFAGSDHDYSSGILGGPVNRSSLGVSTIASSSEMADSFRSGADSLYYNQPNLSGSLRAPSYTSGKAYIPDEEDRTSVHTDDSTVELTSSMKKVHSHTITPPLGDEGPHGVTIVGFEMLRDVRGYRAVFYHIQLADPTASPVFRRYSDFVSLRSYLIKYFQTKVIPPVPEKHSLGRLLRHPFDYKSDTQIIDRRIRLLNYFLERLLSDPAIRESEFIKRFLDPREKYWCKILKGPPFNKFSSKSIYLTSPRNPTAPNPYLTFLPMPPSHANISKGSYKSELNNTVFYPLELRARALLKQVTAMETVSKKLIKDWTASRVSLVELGGFFNIFSIIEDEHEQIEQFGNKIDLDFISIETLVKDATIFIKERLMIARLTLVSVLQLLHFRKLKELQLGYLQEIVLRRQLRLKAITERVLAEQRLDQVMRSGDLQSPSLSKAIAQLKIQRPADVEPRPDSASPTGRSIASSWHEAISAADDPDLINNGSAMYGNGSSLINARGKAVEKMNLGELQGELVKLSRELNQKLIPCFNSLTDDVEYISVGIEESVNNEMWNIVQMLRQIMEDWKTKVYGRYMVSCQGIWKPKADK